MGNLYLLSKCMRKEYLNKSEHFVLHNGGRVVFRRNDFHKDTINEVTSCDKGMETITTILDACLKHLHKKKIRKCKSMRPCSSTGEITLLFSEISLHQLLLCCYPCVYQKY